MTTARPPKWLLALILIGLVGGVVAFTNLASTTATLRAQVMHSDNLIARQARQIAAGEADRLALEMDLQAALAPKAVGSVADFPILRGMARRGDTVQSFAAREGTSDEVIRALNPWLGETVNLKFGQRLWIPKPVTRQDIFDGDSADILGIP